MSPAPAVAGVDELNYGEDWDDALHDPDDKQYGHKGITARAFCNVFTLVFIVLGMLGLFAIWPLVDYETHSAVRAAISTNTHVNSTGQIPKTPTAPSRCAASAQAGSALLTRL